MKLFGLKSAQHILYEQYNTDWISAVVLLISVSSKKQKEGDSSVPYLPYQVERNEAKS